MNPKELRIGNLLQDSISKEIVEVIEVSETEVSETEVKTVVINRDKYPLPNGWFLEPIPLTEEWLVKFGFTFKDSRICSPPNCWHEYEIFKNNMNKTISLSLQSTEVVVYAIVKYVHQLQNLCFSLTREELTLIK